MAELRKIILLRIADLEFAEVSCQLEEDGDKGPAIARHTAQATPTVTLD